MRFVVYPVPSDSEGFLISICWHLVSRHSGYFEHTKHHRPGRFPEGRVGFLGRVSGSRFHCVYLPRSNHRGSRNSFPCDVSNKQSYIVTPFETRTYARTYTNKTNLSRSVHGRKRRFIGRVPGREIMRRRHCRNKHKSLSLYIYI